MSKQKTLFSEQPEPEPTQDGDIEYIGQKLPGDFADYILLEPEENDDLPGDFADYILLEPGEDDDPFAMPFGIAAYVQELYASEAAVIGPMLAGRRAEAVWRNYRQEEGKQQ